MSCFSPVATLDTVSTSLSAAITADLLMAEPQAEIDVSFRGDAYCNLV